MYLLKRDSETRRVHVAAYEKDPKVIGVTVVVTLGDLND